MKKELLSEVRSYTFSIEYAYDGSGFYGWQIQPDRRTVQGELKFALERMLQQPIKIAGAGRTDTGVHALATLASFTATTRWGPNVLFKAMRRMLPRDIWVRRVDLRPEGFNARFTAIRREYEYRILTGHDPFRRHQCWEIGHSLDVDRMRKALEPLKGALDCRAFCVSRSVKEITLCDFYTCSLTEKDDEIRFIISCNRFLHSMVRTLTGTLYDIGRGRFQPERMQEILDSKDRDLCGLTAPPLGLYFRRVFYKDFVTGGEEGFGDSSSGPRIENNTFRTETKA
jgi:tRNA pseudouridine38-40 synthase